MEPAKLAGKRIASAAGSSGFHWRSAAFAVLASIKQPLEE
jgi:hypothetical protein